MISKNQQMLTFRARGNSMDNNHLIKLAKASNINMGDTTERIAYSLSTLQANEQAKATILATKKKMAEQADSKELECDHANINKEGVAADVHREIETETEGGSVPACQGNLRSKNSQGKKGNLKRGMEDNFLEYKRFWGTREEETIWN
jgi:hypothetical protein